ncbi:MAG: carboxypeptidase regulatory-like domain-containing protein [Planctomycetes bacterium]|nr:carboxypeptidase regulatory-like domain-containing protein [Planctomycetota bacterium]
MPLKPIPPDEPEKPDECPTSEGGGATEVALQEEEHVPEEEDTSWIEIELLDEANQPVAGERYKLRLANGRFVRGTLDENGFARIENIPSGNVDVTFSRYDESAWEKA